MKKNEQNEQWVNVLCTSWSQAHMDYLTIHNILCCTKDKTIDQTTHTAPSVKHENHYFSFRHCAIHINSPKFVWRLYMYNVHVYNNELLHRWKERQFLYTFFGSFYVSAVDTLSLMVADMRKLQLPIKKNNKFFHNNLFFLSLDSLILLFFRMWSVFNIRLHALLYNCVRSAAKLLKRHCQALEHRNAHEIEEHATMNRNILEKLFDQRLCAFCLEIWKMSLGSWPTRE